jgi:hypothetical protein
MKKWSALSGLALSLVLAGALCAQETKVEQVILKKEVSGRVSGISKTYLGIEYALDAPGALEIALTMDKNTRGLNKKISQINTGDIVKAVYEETMEIEEDKPTRVKKRLVKSVEFLKAAEEISAE